MKASYALSQPVVPEGSATVLDLLISFDAEATKSERRPLSLSLVIDRSGSMAGVPLKNAVRAASALVDQLLPTDTLSVVVYDDQVQTIVEPQAVANKDAVKAALTTIRPGGMTNLSGGWLKGCEHALSGGGADSLRRVLLLTDGQANAGVTDPQILTKTAGQKAEAGVVTTTLGFGTHFNEDLLIGMARASGGNFYFIQSYDDAADVFKIELDSLKSVAVQNLTVTLQAAPGVQIQSLLSRYRTAPGDALSFVLGDVYEGEPKLLALELSVPAQAALGAHDLLQFSYRGDAVTEGAIVQATGALTAQYQVGAAEDAMSAAPPTDIITQITRIRIARAKDEAIELADAGKHAEAAQTLRAAIADFQRRGLGESFEIAEELEQLEYFAQRLEARKFDNASRKEMRDQSYQAGARNRADLNLRGVASGSARTLPTVTPADAAQGIQVECYRQGGKLRMRVITSGYNPDFNVQFPRAIREEGVTYLVEDLRLSSDGTFYHAGGTIKRVLTPGSERSVAASAPARRSAAKTPAAAAPARTAADLPTTTTVGSGVLVQCIKDGGKLRARVVSDGYDPNFNMRFPRDIREEGTLYVVDEVQEVGGGGSYMTVGAIRRFVQ